MRLQSFLTPITVLVLLLAVTMGGGQAAAAGPTTVGLGTAASFAVLAGTPAVTNTGATTINGNVGIHPAAAVTGFPPGIVNGTIYAANAVALQAKNDLTIAYVDAAGRTPATTVAGGTLGGLTLVGGVYNAGGTTLGLTGTMTLDGQNDPNSVWIFQATSDLVTASSSSVTFINGAQACNVFWQVTSSATLGSGSTFVGTILATASITVASAVSVNGRLLAQTGTVTLINDTITRSACEVQGREIPDTTATPVATRTPTPTPAATATPTVTPAAAPTATPTASAIGITGLAIPTATISPVAATVVLSLPSTATEDDNLSFLFLPIALIVFVVLYLVARARRRRAAPVNVNVN